jgi:hypothetical protein
MIRALPFVLLASGCEVLGDTCRDLDCPPVPADPALATYVADVEPGTEDGVLDVLEDQVVLEYTDEDGHTWRATWPR